MTDKPWWDIKPCPKMIPRDAPPLRTVKGTLIKSRTVACGRPAGHEGDCIRYYQNGLVMAKGHGEWAGAIDHEH